MNKNKPVEMGTILNSQKIYTLQYKTFQLKFTMNIQGLFPNPGLDTFWPLIVWGCLCHPLSLRVGKLKENLRVPSSQEVQQPARVLLEKQQD